MQARVSVALCTYNGQTFLPQQLQSLLDQSILPSEVVICDDVSSDQSLAIAQSFAERAPFPVRIFRNPQNLGYVRNFEQAIARCTGDVVFLCDQDDVWHPQKIETVLGIFAQNPGVGLVLHDFDRIDGQGQAFDPPHARDAQRQLLSQEISQHSIRVFMEPSPQAWCGCMMAFRRQWSDVLLPIFPGKGHDDWILKLLAPITGVHYTAQALMSYRIHTHNSNNDEVLRQTQTGLKARLLRRLRKWGKRLHHWRMGYSKKNFYTQILQRLRASGLPIQQAELIQIYQRYANKRF